MGHYQQQPPILRKLRRLMYISPVISVLSVILLIWVYRSVMIFQPWMLYYQATTVPKIPGQPPESQKNNPEHIDSLEEKLSIVEVTGTSTLLISAYLERRTEIKEVRVIAIVLRSETVAYRCLFCCQRKLHISEGFSDIHSDHFDFAYGTAFIMCPVPSGCETPSHITVTSAAANSEVMLQAADEQCNDKLDQRFLEVRNQGEKSDLYNFTVCISTMFDFTNVLQLVQSLEILQLLGVNRVVIYKTNCSAETQRILDYYTQKGLVEVIPWSLSRFLKVSHSWLPSLSAGDIHYFGQIPALNDCLYRYMYQTRYLAMHDVDELILPQSVNSWLELLPLLEKQYGADKCYEFENNIFPINVALPLRVPQTLPLQDHWQNVSGVNILDHLYQEPIIKETYNSNFKIIFNSQAVYSPTVHGVLKSQNGCSWIDKNIARMYHTRAPRQPQLTPDQLIYDGRLLSYSARLTPAVNNVLRESGLLPVDI